jgi:histone-lysine N-methyltransferase SETMAR
MRRLQLLQGKIWPAFFWNSLGVLLIDFLIEQWIIDTAYYSKLLKDRVKPAFLSKRRGRSVNARPPTAAVTTGSFEEMHWGGGVLPHPAYSPSDLAPSDFHLFRPLKRALGRKRFSADDEVKPFRATMAGRSTTNCFWKGHNETAGAISTVYRGFSSWKKLLIFFIKKSCLYLNCPLSFVANRWTMPFISLVTKCRNNVQPSNKRSEGLRS